MLARMYNERRRAYASLGFTLPRPLRPTYRHAPTHGQAPNDNAANEPF
ncbi:MAG: hypothetical protein ACRD0V_17945 [Acidimicrobiales bacterium]